MLLSSEGELWLRSWLGAGFCMVVRIFSLKSPAIQSELPPGFFVQRSMQCVQELDWGTIKPLVKQRQLLLRTHEAEFAKNPTSRATDSSRSNLMAVQHAVEKIYGEVVARGVAISSGCGGR